jgi:phosphoesterase RecJ-like protein
MDTIISQLQENDRVLVITHTHADLDSVGSAVGLAITLDATVEIATPSDVTAGAAALLDDYPVVAEPDLDTYDIHIVVDAPSAERIAPLDPTATDVPLVDIDHHEPADLQERAAQAYIDTDAPATALLVADILESTGVEISSEAAMALAAGLLDDTGFRAVVRSDSRDQILSLLQQAEPYETKLASLWETDTPWSERVATAKAVVRASGYKAGETILLLSRVSGQETAAAHALIAGNADIAVIVSERGDHIRVVGRVSEQDDVELALPSNVLQPLAAEFGGYAGGHAGAGVAKLETTDASAVEQSVVECIEDALGMQFVTLS